MHIYRVCKSYRKIKPCLGPPQSWVPIELGSLSVFRDAITYLYGLKHLNGSFLGPNPKVGGL